MQDLDAKIVSFNGKVNTTNAMNLFQNLNFFPTFENKLIEGFCKSNKSLAKESFPFINRLKIRIIIDLR